MSASKAYADDFSFVAEKLTGQSCASVLRKTWNLAETAPAGKAFAAIATLSEVSKRAAQTLEISAEALAHGDDEAAELELARSYVIMNKMSAEAEKDAAPVIARPAYLKRRRVHFDF
jgi:hypothetical protein